LQERLNEPHHFGLPVFKLQRRDWRCIATATSSFADEVVVLRKRFQLFMHLRHWLLVFAIATIFRTTMQADGFEVGGTIETVTTRTNRHTFLINADGADVLIHCSAGIFDKGIKSIEFGSDGTNGFLLHRADYRVEPGKTNGLVNDATMHIEACPIPPRQAGITRQVWLTFATSHQLGTGSGGYIRPRSYILMEDVKRDFERWQLLNEHLLSRAEWSFNPSPPHVLQRFVEFRDSKWDTDRYSPDLIPASLRDGRTNLLFEVLAWTNVAGLHLPADAQITAYQAVSDKPDEPLHVRMTHRIHITHIARALPRRSFIPEPTLATDVIDYRFAESPRKPASYLTKDGVIYHTAEDAWAAADRRNNEAVQRNLPKEGIK
jgi:hypothetical protein